MLYDTYFKGKLLAVLEQAQVLTGVLIRIQWSYSFPDYDLERILGTHFQSIFYGTKYF